ncbi:MAG: peptidylprolyl isomerase [Candidatus Margulisbacteria bacterium]|nr:peptidylprolyl isomerase [Candidatus Margulisiibacteriota bacterium]
MTKKKSLIATMSTNKGPIRLELFAEETPLTVANFVNLIQAGYYDGLSFHRVIEDFMIQGGCPSGTGTGGPGYQFEDECTPTLRHDKPGILSMANSGPGTNGSQFFITHVPTPWLDGNHTVFGQVVSEEDQDVVNQIEQGDQILSVTIEGDTTKLLANVAETLAAWNDILEEEFPNLKKEEIAQ